MMLPEWAALIVGIPAIMVAFGLVLWTRGFGPADRELFRMKRADIEDMSIPAPGETPQPPG